MNFRHSHQMNADRRAMPGPVGVVALLLGFLFTLVPEGRGAIVYFESQNISIPDTYAGVSVDLETGNSSTS